MSKFYKIHYKTLGEGLYVYANHLELKNDIGTPLEIAHLYIENGQGTDVYVAEEFRRMGIATALYERGGEILGEPVRKGKTQSEDGESFWKSKNK